MAMTSERFDELSVLAARRGVLTFPEVCELLAAILEDHPEFLEKKVKPPKPAA